MMALAGRVRRAGNGEAMSKRFQSGCLFKRGARHKVWVARWREPRKMADGSMGSLQRSEILGTVADLSKTQAQRLMAAKLAPLNSGMVRPVSAATFKEFAAEWEAGVLCSYRSSTRKFYKSTLDRWLIPYWSQWRLENIRLMDVRKWLNSYTDTYASSVVKHMRATLSKMLSDAVEMGQIDRNPAKGFRTPRGKPVKRARCYRATRSRLSFPSWENHCERRSSWLASWGCANRSWRACGLATLIFRARRLP